MHLPRTTRSRPELVRRSGFAALSDRRPFVLPVFAFPAIPFVPTRTVARYTQGVVAGLRRGYDESSDLPLPRFL